MKRTLEARIRALELELEAMKRQPLVIYPQIIYIPQVVYPQPIPQYIPFNPYRGPWYTSISSAIDTSLNNSYLCGHNG